MWGRSRKSGVIHAYAECQTCGVVYDSRNALGLAAQHHDKTGHTINTEQCISVTYGNFDSDDDKE